MKRSINLKNKYILSNLFILTLILSVFISYAGAAEKKAAVIIDLPVNILSCKHFQDKIVQKTEEKLSDDFKLIPFVDTQILVRVYRDENMIDDVGGMNSNNLILYDIKALNKDLKADRIFYYTIEGNVNYNKSNHSEPFGDLSCTLKLFDAKLNNWQTSITKNTVIKGNYMKIMQSVYDYEVKYDERCLDLILEALNDIMI